ncbi:hypothetical protein C8T65DRAFT_736745 [Cerioporus squamosus]|nr:hypothetical protein C8T65DRAFT_736745 [Cerioporus squamosus]
MAGPSSDFSPIFPGQSATYQPAAMEGGSISAQEHTRVLNELQDLKQLVYQLIQPTPQAQSQAPNAMMAHAGIPLASVGAHVPHGVPLGMAPLVEPAPIVAPMAPTAPAIPPATMGPDGKPVYPDLSLQFPERAVGGLYLVLPWRQENYLRVPYFTRKQYMDELKKHEVPVPGRTTKAKRGRPRKEYNDGAEGESMRLSLPFVTDVWGIPITNERADYMRATGRCWWQKALDEGRAPDTWRYGANTEIIEEFYRFMYERFPELALAEDHWKLEWICVHGYPSFKQERRRQFEALARKRAAEAKARDVKETPVATEKKKKKHKKVPSEMNQKGKGKARDDGEQVPDLSTIAGSSTLDDAPFQIPPEEEDLKFRPLSPPLLADIPPRKRSLFVEPPAPESHADEDTADVFGEPLAKRARCDLEDASASLSGLRLPLPRNDPSSSPPPSATTPALTAVPSGTQSAVLEVSKAASGMIPHPEMKIRNPLENMWGGDTTATANSDPALAQESTEAPIAVTKPDAEASRVPGDETVATTSKKHKVPGKAGTGKAPAASKPSKPWPPSIEADQKHKAKCARLWVTLNPGGTEDIFESFYKPMDDRQRKRWYTVNKGVE